MGIIFDKYQATGNDFIIINNLKLQYDKTEKLRMILPFCERHFGIGADGVIFVEPSNQEGIDFIMDYYNSDGTQSFCGNGSRAVFKYALDNDIVKGKATFLAIDGIHKAKIIGNNIVLTMSEVAYKNIQNSYEINTGSPHYITEVKDLDNLDIITKARAIRNNDKYKQEGINVNFIEFKNNEIKMRTYERGVEAETYSCGTGVTAVAIYTFLKNKTKVSPIIIKTRGGELKVSLEKSQDKFSNIKLIGPADLVFRGEVNN